MKSWAARAARAVAASVVDLPPGTAGEPGLLPRRRVATVLTIPVGAVLLRASLSRPPGDPVFYLLTAAVAATWLAGGLLSGPLPLGWLVLDGKRRRPVVVPVLTGLVAAAAVVAAAQLARQLPPLRADLADVLSHAHDSVPAVGALALLNGAAEEVFFRGCVYPAARGHPVAVSTAVYALVVAVTGSPALVLAAVGLGLLLGLQRRATGGILAPILTHLTWSACALPALSWLFTH